MQLFLSLLYFTRYRIELLQGCTKWASPGTGTGRMIFQVTDSVFFWLKQTPASNLFRKVRPAWKNQAEFSGNRPWNRTRSYHPCGVPLGEQNFYTVVFAVSRTMGVMAQYIWSRAAPWRPAALRAASGCRSKGWMAGLKRRGGAV